MMIYYKDTSNNVYALYAGQSPGESWIEITENEALEITNPAPTLDAVKSSTVAAIALACQSAIYAGFTSAALGTTHTYPTDDKSQFNLTASVTDSLLPNLPANWTTPFMCADSSGNWAMRPHTAAQIQQAGSDGKAFVVKNLQQNAALAAEVTAATTVAAVQAIAWTNPV